MVGKILLILFSIFTLANCSRVSFSPLSSDELSSTFDNSLPDDNRVTGITPPANTGLGPIVDPKSGLPSALNPVVPVSSQPTQSSSGGLSPISSSLNSNNASAQTVCNQNTNLSFNVYSQITVSSYYNYSGKFKISVNELDIYKNKSAFLAISIKNILHLYNFKTSQFIDSRNVTSYADYALSLPNDKCQYPFEIFQFNNADLSALGGAMVFAGYGVGGNADIAANEMMSFRDASHASGRFHLLFNIPDQPASVSFVNLGYNNTQLQGTANVFVKSEDYLKNGYYFLAANSSDGSVWYLYTGSMWIKFDGNNFASVGGMQALKNQSVSFTAEITNTQLADFKLYAGYAVGENLSQVFSAFVSNSQGTRNATPYVLEANPSLQKDSLNFNIQAYASGALSSYNIFSFVKIADAHKEQQGYIFGVILFQSEYYVYHVQQQKFVKWDGILASFPAAGSLKSQINYVNFANNIDVTVFGGAKFYMGYGVGSSPAQAVNEMLSSTRWREIATIPVQNFSGTITIPNYSKTSTSQVVLDFRIYPDYKDYSKAGNYYVILSTPDNSSYAVYNGTSWVGYTGGAQDTTLYTASSTAMKNYSTQFSIKGVDLAPYAGYKLYVGYGKSIPDMLSKGTYSSPTIIP